MFSPTGNLLHVLTCQDWLAQNSALGAVLATLHFADPLTAVPCAISATTHSLLGSAFAGFWRLRGPGQPQHSSTGGATVDAGSQEDSMAARKTEARRWIAAWRKQQH
jgi:BASS family bile acid:Na+ symporter